MMRHTGGDHGQGVLYAAAQERGALRLRRPEALPAAVVLTNGRVTCTTCHDGASDAPHHLARAGTFANVCVSCHDM
jgi:predicted CXXCH cytochrome family protein